MNRILPTFAQVADVVAVLETLPDPELTYDWSLFEAWYKYRDGNNVSRQIDIVAEAEADFERFACHPDLKSRAKASFQRVRDGFTRHQGGGVNAHDKLAKIAPEVMAHAVANLTIDGLEGVLR